MARWFQYKEIEEISEKISEVAWNSEQDEETKRKLTDVHSQLERLAERQKTFAALDIVFLGTFALFGLAFGSGVIDL